MTTGQMVFYSGVGLLVLTIIVALVFLIKKPKYIPETAVYGDAVSNVTQRLRNGYPTERVTIRRETAQSQPEQGTELIAGEETELLSQTEKLIK
ncbi:hypothetical protein AALB19_06620 [Oscillospiraceae bacterium 50-58]